MERLRLSNGFTLLVGQYNGQTSGIDLCFNYGSAFEKPSDAGIAHFLEHMFFSASKKLGRKKAFEVVEKAGGELNAFTSKEETHYYSRIQNNAFSKPLGVLAECFNDGFFREKDIALEKKIVLNEIRESYDDPVRRLFDEFLEICLEHPYNRRTIGSKETVSRLSAQKLRSCLKENYSSSNGIIGVATSLNKEKVIHELETRFSERKGHRHELKPKPVRPRAAEHISLTKIEQAHCCLGFPVMNAPHKDSLVMELIDEYLGGGLSARLPREIREKRGLSYAVSTWLNSEKSHGVFGVYFSANKKRVSIAKKLILKEFGRLQNKMLGKSTVIELKQKMLGRKALEFENSFQMSKALVETELYGRPDPQELNKEILRITPEDIQRVAREFLQTEEFTFACLKPAS